MKNKKQKTNKIKKIKKQYKKTYKNKQKKLNGCELCEDPNAKYVSYLMHGTTFDNFKKILDTFSLIPGKGDKEQIIMGHKHTFNKGVFMELVFNCNKNKPIKLTDCTRPIILVFSNTLLSRNDYHINNKHIGGIKLKPFTNVNSFYNISRSYSKAQYFDFLSENENIMCNKPFSLNEIVFTNEVSLENLKEIWICDIPYVDGFISSKTPLKNNGTLPEKEYTRDMHRQYINDDFITSIKTLVGSHKLLSNLSSNIKVKLIASIPGPQDTEYCDKYGEKNELSLTNLKI